MNMCKLNVSTHHVLFCRRFYQKVQQVNKTGVFNTGEFHTYFIPVDAGMQVSSVTLLLDRAKNDKVWNLLDAIPFHN